MFWLYPSWCRCLRVRSAILMIFALNTSLNFDPSALAGISRRCTPSFQAIQISSTEFFDQDNTFWKCFFFCRKMMEIDLKLSKTPTSRRRWRLFMAGHAMLNRWQMEKTYVALQICFVLFLLDPTRGFGSACGLCLVRAFTCSACWNQFFCILVANSIQWDVAHQIESKVQLRTKKHQVNGIEPASNSEEWTLTMPCTILPCNKKWRGINVCTISCQPVMWKAVIFRLMYVYIYIPYRHVYALCLFLTATWFDACHVMFALLEGWNLHFFATSWNKWAAATKIGLQIAL